MYFFLQVYTTTTFYSDLMSFTISVVILHHFIKDGTGSCSCFPSADTRTFFKDGIHNLADEVVLYIFRVLKPVRMDSLMILHDHLSV